MSYFALFQLSDGHQFAAEVDGLDGLELATEAEEGMSLAGLRRTGKTSLGADSIQHSLDSLVDSVATILRRFTDMRSDELTVEVGIKLSAEVGVAIAKTATEGHLQVTMKWLGEPVHATLPAD